MDFSNARLGEIHGFTESASFNRVEIPASIEIIAESAFRGCPV
jgi:hypothetical protein